ncbi:MAG TPA: aminoglycoside phosphotransferase family protein, partial [Gaiellaceae bacterium]|nr:aminoglycoside phosphotransferase family protein [Gaiellaceae bacterium]
MERLGWMDGYSDPELRAALNAAAPRFANLPITLQGRPDLSNPIWAAGRATVGEDVFVKLAFSERTAVRIWREAQALDVLGELGLSVPQLVAAGRNPTLSATRLISGGAPLSYETVAAATPEAIEAFASHLARFLSELHAPLTLERLRGRLESLPQLPEAGLHLTTNDLRARFAPMLEPRQRAIVSRWCDWVDDELARPGDTVFVHGDLHPYNQLWDLDELRLLAVVDFETSGLGNPEFDFRVLPVFGPNVYLLMATVRQYEAMSGRNLDMPRIMALFLL